MEKNQERQAPAGAERDNLGRESGRSETSVYRKTSAKNHPNTNREMEGKPPRKRVGRHSSNPPFYRPARGESSTFSIGIDF
jgi:hypothetical protein